ncbi:aspartyl protease family protein [Aliiglaciecola sp. LCG003]|uniref:aspartyl protease family protein n=1 Tax=Aliiglaciecola sp. LCG003 TaxID=3053655 RepID=UPI0025740BE7|nr:aspartyl protease family protein [Aliiglaciecola sp. LCG003]WJG11279.1 aspartyl protease family protein [Aliiglaciecola sp. LCG003]
MTTKKLSLIIISACFIFISNAKAGVSNWVDFELSGGHVKVPVEIGGNSGYAILDSGAQLNGINKSFIFKHKLEFNKGRKVKVKGIYGVERRQNFSSVEVSMFGQNLPFDSFTELSLGHYKNAILLGAPFFSAFIVQIDYPNSRLRYMSRDAIDLSEIKNVTMTKQKGSGMPIVKIDINNEKSTWLILDTGNSGGVMLERNAAKRWIGKYATSASVAFGANSMGFNESFRIPKVQFGPYTLENVLINVPAEGQRSQVGSRYESSESRIKGKKVEGLLGFDLLQHFVLTLDYTSGSAHIAAPVSEGTGQ